jgi:hypothetical protein
MSFEHVRALGAHAFTDLVEAAQQVVSAVVRERGSRESHET